MKVGRALRVSDNKHRGVISPANRLQTTLSKKPLGIAMVVSCATRLKLPYALNHLLQLRRAI